LLRDIGIEYNFDIPLLISLDFRPEFGGNGYYKNNYGSDMLWVLNTNSSIKLFIKKNATRGFLIIIFLELILTTQNGVTP
jgi:hypothetical protein